ncbi:hypothetical protein BD779DRAFT_1469670 [Infundibulicybe gibba]|nr:hypothetical protein BD779DRAFT_1469670 [Infundibulicybe gibba]
MFYSAGFVLIPLSRRTPQLASTTKSFNTTHHRLDFCRMSIHTNCPTRRTFHLANDVNDIGSYGWGGVVGYPLMKAAGMCPVGRLTAASAAFESYPSTSLGEATAEFELLVEKAIRLHAIDTTMFPTASHVGKRRPCDPIIAVTRASNTTDFLGYWEDPTGLPVPGPLGPSIGSGCTNGWEQFTAIGAQHLNETKNGGGDSPRTPTELRTARDSLPHHHTPIFGSHQEIPP